MNSTSLNTCSSVCSMQPFNSHQQTFRYFSESQRPFVVSFKRINKVTLPNNNNSSLIDRCSSICDIHRHELDAKNRHCKRKKNPYKQNGSQSCRNFNYIDGKVKAHFDNEEESPQHDRDRITITYPKEKFHGNAKLLLTINADDDVLKFNRYSINTEAAPNLYFTTSERNRNFLHYLNNDITTMVRKMNKSTSTPILNKLDKSTDFELKERKQSFVSILNVRAKEAHLVRNSKSY